MKKLLMTTMLAALTTGLQAADYQYLVFTTSDGQQAVAATDLTLTVSGTNLVASSGTTTLATIPLSILTQMEFSNSETTGISTLTTNTLNIDEATEVYDLNGRRMPLGTQLPTGVYIMKINGRNVKVGVK